MNGRGFSGLRTNCANTSPDGAAAVTTAFVSHRFPRRIKPGAKYYEWELRGVPVRIELGPRDLEKNACVAARRDKREKLTLPLDGLATAIGALLDDIQTSMLAAARERREANSIREPITYDRFRELMEGEGGFVYAGWNGDRPGGQVKPRRRPRSAAFPIRSSGRRRSRRGAW
jgi:prolyl-tRNA synthetase